MSELPSWHISKFTDWERTVSEIPPEWIAHSGQMIEPWTSRMNHRVSFDSNERKANSTSYHCSLCLPISIVRPVTTQHPWEEASGMILTTQTTTVDRKQLFWQPVYNEWCLVTSELQFLFHATCTSRFKRNIRGTMDKVYYKKSWRLRGSKVCSQ